MSCADPRYDIDTKEVLAAPAADIVKGRIDGDAGGRVACSLY